MTLALFLTASGCATIGTGEGKTQERLLGTTPSEDVSRNKFTAEMHQDGTKLDVTAWAMCTPIEKERILSTTRYERVNLTPGIDWGVGIAGVGLSSIGTAFLIDTRSVAPSDDSARRYNPYGPGVGYAIGIGAVVAGVALLSIPVIDAARSGGGTEKTNETERPGRSLGQPHRCDGGRGLAGVMVTALANDKPVDVGRTGPDGKLSVELTTVIPSAFSYRAGSSSRLTVLAEKETLGDLDPAPIHRARDEMTWTLLPREECASPRNTTDCNAVKDYIENFPDSSHVAEAKKILSAGAPKLARLEADLEWSNAYPENCENPTEPSACDNVQSYLQKHPTGAHAAEASAVLGRGRLKIQSMKQKKHAFCIADCAAGGMICSQTCGGDSPCRSGCVTLSNLCKAECN